MIEFGAAEPQANTQGSSRKKIIKLVTQNSSTSNAAIASGMISLKQPATVGSHTTKNVNSPGLTAGQRPDLLDSSQGAMLVSNYYQ